MGTALTASIDGTYTAPAVVNVHLLDDGSAVGWEDQGVITDASGRTFAYDGWTAYEQDQMKLAFAQFSAVANISFNFVTDIALADFVMASGNSEEVGGSSYWNVGGGTITVGGVEYEVDGVGVFDWEGQGWDFNGATGGLEPGGFGFLTLIDQIGRGLGLAHPHDTDGGSTIMNGVSTPTGDYGAFDLNQGIYTTMSFNDGWHTAPHGTSPSDVYGWQGTPMALDIAVLQETYGANNGTNLGDTVYVLPDTHVSGTYYQAVWDAGGTDTILYGGNGHATIDLRAATLQYEAGGGGFISYVSGIHGGVTIANGTVIENATGGAGNDTIIGNNSANVLMGGPGADLLDGGSGRDTASYRNASAGVVADLGNPANNAGDALGDTYVGIENLEGGDFEDQLAGDAAGNALTGGAGDDHLFGDAGADVLYGGSGNDALAGGDGNDRLVGGTEDDNLHGGGGDDRLAGQGGADILDGGNGNDALGGGGGDDRLLGGTGGDNLNGGHGNDHLLGQAGADVLSGGAGNDVLGGGSGHDRLIGQAGADVLAGGVGNDVLGGGGGEDDLIGGSGADILRGGDGNDRLYGSAGTDQLFGNAGRDTLAGEAGDDWLSGGGGDDAFVFRPAGGHDVVADFQDDFDLLDFSAFGFASKSAVLDLAAQSGADVLFSLPDGSTATLSTFDLALLGAEDLLI